VELLDLTLIGWLFSVGSGVALALGAVIVALYYSRGGAQTQASRHMLGDLLLFGIWLLGLTGGIGVLLAKSWSRPVLELFCWAFMVLLILSCWSQLRVAPPPRGMRAVSMALFVIPIIAVCCATIVTLRGESAVRVLSG
jgi:hypothetical protein